MQRMLSKLGGSKSKNDSTTTNSEKDKDSIARAAETDDKNYRDRDRRGGGGQGKPKSFGKSLFKINSSNSHKTASAEAKTKTVMEEPDVDHGGSKSFKSNDYYLSKIQALERVIAEMRKFSTKTVIATEPETAPDAIDIGEAEVENVAVAVPGPANNPGDADRVLRVDEHENQNDDSATDCRLDISDASSSIPEQQSQVLEQSQNEEDKIEATNTTIVFATEEEECICESGFAEPRESNDILFEEALVRATETKEPATAHPSVLEVSVAFTEEAVVSQDLDLDLLPDQEEGGDVEMNYFRSRFLHRDNAAVSSESALRDYRYRRKIKNNDLEDLSALSLSSSLSRSSTPSFTFRSLLSPSPTNWLLHAHVSVDKSKDDSVNNVNDIDRQTPNIDEKITTTTTCISIPKKSNSFRRKRETDDDDVPSTKRNSNNSFNNNDNAATTPSVLTTVTASSCPGERSDFFLANYEDYRRQCRHDGEKKLSTPGPEHVQNDTKPATAVEVETKPATPVCDEKPREASKEEDEEDPLGFIQIKSAAQWMAVSKRISWNFDDQQEKQPEVSTKPATLPVTKEEDVQAEDNQGEEAREVEVKTPVQSLPRTPTLPRDYENAKYDIYAPVSDNDNSSLPPEFKPTKVQQLRLVCWKVKPWKSQKPSFGHKRLFTTQFAAPWGCDCDEVHPGLFIGDAASATNVRFLKKYGITHVLNAAEGNEEGLVNLSDDHYDGSGITYLGFPLWDAPGCNLIPYLGCAADFINGAIDANKGNCLVNCQMGVSRSSSCALAYLMIYKRMTAVEALTLVRQSRDCRPNDGFLVQLANLDNELRKERECGVPRKIKLSSLDDRNRLPLSWHYEFWTPGEAEEEELGFPLVHMGQDRILQTSTASPAISKKSSRRTSCQVSRRSSKRNSFREPTPLRRTRPDCVSLSRCSSTKRSRPSSSCLSAKSVSTPEDDRDWEWVWEDESDDEAVEEELKAIPIRDPSKDLDAVSAVSESTSNISNGGSMIEHKLEKVKDIIAKPEEKWRQLPSPTGSTRSSNAAVTGSVSIQAGVEDGDPLALVKVASAKQWRVISRKLTINFDDLEEREAAKTPTPTNATALTVPSITTTMSSPSPPKSPRSRRPATPDSFKPTTVQQMRRICWQIKPWDVPTSKKTFAERQLFTAVLGSGWGVDCDEVHPRILVGDAASARNINFLKKYGITHVLNTAEGIWAEHCVNLTEDYYDGSGITYLGLPLWDSTDVKILQYLGCAAEFIKLAMERGQKCLVNCQMGVSRSCTAAMSYLMLHENMEAVEVLRTFRRRRDVRPNDYFLEQIVALDNDLRKHREHGQARKINLVGLEDLKKLPKPWHFEFWNDIPDDLPFDLTHVPSLRLFRGGFSSPQSCSSRSMSKRTSVRSSTASEWEWEYYDVSSSDEEQECKRIEE